MFLEGRPPVNVGVTSNGDIFGGTAGQLRRRARRQAVQLLRRVDLAVPHAVAVVRQPVAPLPVRAAGLLADAVLLRPARRRASTTRRSRRSSAATDAIATRTVRGGTRVRHLPVQPLPPRRAVRPASCSSTRSTTIPALQAASRAVPAGSCTASSVPQRHADAARRRVRPGDDRLPRVRTAGRQHDAAGVRRRAEDRQPAVAADARRRRAPLPAPRRQRRCSRRASAASRAPATSPTSCTSAATRRLRGYDYLQFVGQNVVFANAELRFPLIEAALTPIGVIGGIRGVFFANIGGALVQQPAVVRSVHVVAATSSRRAARKPAA